MENVTTLSVVAAAIYTTVGIMMITLSVWLIQHYTE